MSTVKIGWARREISTNEPVSIPGQMYIRVSEGIHDPLYVTALCVDGGEGQDKIIFLSCDIVTQFGGILQPIRDKLKERRPEIPQEGFILNVTHTHSSIALGKTPEKTPDGVEIFPGEKSRDFFCEMAAQAIIEAWDNRKEGGIGYGYGYAVVGHSRRVVYFKEEKLASNKRQFMTPAGYAVMYGKTNDPLFSHYEAGADHFLNLMFTFDEKQKLTGIVVNVPCPSQLCEHFTKLSADYWTYVRELIAKEYGPDVYVLPQCAAAGDVSPRTLHYTKAQARSPFIQTFVIQLAGTEGGNYLATHRGAEAKGYSASMFCNMVSADGGHQWVENQLEILNDMKAQDEQ